MKASAYIAQTFSRWIDEVAGSVAGLLDRFASPRSAQLVEDENGQFVLQNAEPMEAAASSSPRVQIIDGRLVGPLPPEPPTTLSGGRIELILQPARFLFRPLELPARAAEFLDGIVRSQIDRLTPWSAAEAAFGWSKPAEAGTDRIVVTVAATAMTVVRPYVRAVSAIGAHSIQVFTAAPESGVPIRVLQESTRGVLDSGRIRQALLIILVAAGLGASAALGASAIIAAKLAPQQQELAGRIAAARAAAGGRDIAAGSLTAAQRMLARRKQQTPSSVLIVEAVSAILPDHSYVTELRVEGDKLRLIGVTRDAPSLIGLLEQSGQFSGASFFAPTTRSPSDAGERFHIEAKIQPLRSPRS